MELKKIPVCIKWLLIQNTSQYISQSKEKHVQFELIPMCGTDQEAKIIRHPEMLNIPQNDTGGEKLSFSEPSTLQAQIKKI